MNYVQSIKEELKRKTQTVEFALREIEMLREEISGLIKKLDKDDPYFTRAEGTLRYFNLKLGDMITVIKIHDEV